MLEWIYSKSISRGGKYGGKFVELMSDIRQSDYERTERLINQVREVLYGHYYRRDNSLLNNQPTVSKMVGKTSEVNGLWQDKKYLLQNVTERNVKLL